MNKLKVGLTQGDTNGIGLEIVLKTILAEGITELYTPVLFANRRLVQSTIEALGEQNVKFNLINSAADAHPGRLNMVVVDQSNISPDYGTPTPESGRQARLSLEAATRALADGDIDLLVTAPIHKGAIQSEEFNFPGHTEFLETHLGGEGEKSQMILFNDRLRVALLTTHLPLSEIASNVKKEKIVDAVKRFDSTLRRDFGCERPTIAILSLNPHCGDGGVLGSEEQTEIIPAIEQLHEDNILAFGPYAADGFFADEAWQRFDGVLAMYHDQGLAPFKALAGKYGVNFTAGLGKVRTSPDHGTAYDIAGEMKADPTSLKEAIYRGIDIKRRRTIFDEVSANPLTITPIKK